MAAIDQFTTDYTTNGSPDWSGPLNDVGAAAADRYEHVVANVTALNALTGMWAGMRVWVTGTGAATYNGSSWDYDSGYLSVGVLATTGWSLSSLWLRRLSPTLAACSIVVTRQGAAIAVPTTGDIANTQIATVTNTKLQPSTSQNLHSGGSGRVAAGFIGSDGSVMLGAVGGTSNILTGDVINLGGMYALG